MDKLYTYTKSRKNHVKGWFSRVDSQIFYEILSHQNQTGINGSVAEIGLHHGKSFIALCLGLVGDQKAYGIDVFENQSLNLDHSGKGVRDIVLRHLDGHGVSRSSFFLDGRSSEMVKAHEIIDTVGQIRFFSIDGGHWREIVRNDLELAKNVLTDGGVIALDDFYRPEWPDVSVGFFEWFQSSNRNIVPFAIGHNKLYLCHESRLEELRGVLNRSRFLRHFVSKHYNYLGNVIPVFQAYPLPEWTMRQRLQGYLELYHPDLYVRLRGLVRA